MKICQILNVLGIYEQAAIRLHTPDGEIEHIPCSRFPQDGTPQWYEAYERYGKCGVLAIRAEAIREGECVICIHAEEKPGDAARGYAAQRERGEDKEGRTCAASAST